MAVVRFGVRHGLFDARHAGMGLIFVIASLLVLINFPKGVFNYFMSYLVASVTNRIGTDVRGEMYAHLQTLPLSYFHRSRIGHIIARMSYDVNLIQGSSQVVVTAIDGPMTGYCRPRADGFDKLEVDGADYRVRPADGGGNR